VYIPKSLTGTRRVRKFFETRTDAELFAEAARRRGWETAIEEEGIRGGSAGSRNGGRRVEEIWSAWMAYQERVAASTMRKFRYVGKAFCGRFGGREMRGLTHREIGDWLDGLECGNATRWDHYRVVRRCWVWARDYLEEVAGDPFLKIRRPPAKEDGAQPEVLSAVEMRRCFAVRVGMPAREAARWIVFLSLGGFCGLRTAEIFCVRWEDVTENEVFVRQPKRVRGWMPRYVSLPENAREWLRVARELAGGDEKNGNEGKDGLDGVLVLPGGQRELYTIRRSVMDALGWQRWPQNCLRHSYGTYHLAGYRDLARTRTEMGHESEGVTRAHYATAARRADAEAWWGIMPE